MRGWCERTALQRSSCWELTGRRCIAAGHEAPTPKPCSLSKKNNNNNNNDSLLKDPNVPQARVSIQPLLDILAQRLWVKFQTSWLTRFFWAELGDETLPRKYQASAAPVIMRMMSMMTKRARRHVQDRVFQAGGASASKEAPTCLQETFPHCFLVSDESQAHSTHPTTQLSHRILLC